MVKRPFQIAYRNRLFRDVYFRLSVRPQDDQEKIVIPVMVKNFGIFSKEELESGRKFLRRSFGKDIRVEVVVKAFYPKTKKPSEVRMGKGKGKIAFWVSPIRAGQVIFKLSGLLNFKKVFFVIQQLSKKFSKDLFVIDPNFFQTVSLLKMYKRELRYVSFRPFRI